MVDPSNEGDPLAIPSLLPKRDQLSSFAPRIKVVDEWTRDGIAEVRAGVRSLRLMMGAVLLAVVVLALLVVLVKFGEVPR